MVAAPAIILLRTHLIISNSNFNHSHNSIISNHITINNISIHNTTILATITTHGIGDKMKTVLVIALAFFTTRCYAQQYAIVAPQAQVVVAPQVEDQQLADLLAARMQQRALEVIQLRAQAVSLEVAQAQLRSYICSRFCPSGPTTLTVPPTVVPGAGINPSAMYPSMPGIYGASNYGSSQYGASSYGTGVNVGVQAAPQIMPGPLNTCNRVSLRYPW
jgi:hypothetical protein